MSLSPEILQLAKEQLQAGQLICFPTDTVYALAANATDSQAIKKIYTAKQRSEQKPLALLVASVEQAKQFVIFDERAEEIAKQHWPGALTLILPQKQNTGLVAEVNEGLTSLAVRMPNHPIALELLEIVDMPLACTSVNLSGDTEALDTTTAQNILGDKVALYVDNNQESSGVASTVIDLTGDEARVVRQGMVELGDGG